MDYYQRQKLRACHLFTCRRECATTRFSMRWCGRATGKDGVAVFVEHGLRALEDWLHSEGVRKHSEREATGPTVILDEETHSEKR